MYFTSYIYSVLWDIKLIFYGLKKEFPYLPCYYLIKAKTRENTYHFTNELTGKPVKKIGKVRKIFRQIGSCQTWAQSLYLMKQKGLFYFAIIQILFGQNKRV